MGVIAEVRFTGPDLPILDSLECVPEMELDVEQAIAEDPERPILFFWAEGEPFEPFESALEDDPTVASVDAVEDVGARRLYRVQVSADAGTVLYPADVAIGASRLAVTATVVGIEARIRFPDRDAVSEYLDICREAGASVSVRRLYRGGTTSPDGSYGLSEKQLEALQCAADVGYFAVPRTVELDDVAAELDVSRQAASERIRRGVATLLGNTVGTGVTDGSAMYDV